MAGKVVLVAVALVMAAVVMAIAVVSMGAGPRPVTLFTKAESRKAQILTIAKELQQIKVSPVVSLRAAQALSAFHTLCGAPSSAGTVTKSEMERRRRRADKNWWDVIKAFKTADEVQSAVLADPHHVHLLIYVAPGWCHFSKMQIEELQRNFDNLGESQERVHFIDADEPKNANLMAYQGVKSFPTIVAVQGNIMLGMSEGYQAFDVINKMAYADEGGKVFDTTFPSA